MMRGEGVEFSDGRVVLLWSDHGFHFYHTIEEMTRGIVQPCIEYLDTDPKVYGV